LMGLKVNITKIVVGDTSDLGLPHPAFSASNIEKECVFMSGADIRGYQYVNGIGPNPKNQTRKVVQTKFEELGCTFHGVISSTASVGNSCDLATDVQILSKALVNNNVSIGRAAVINSGAIVEHDCCIGDFVHLSPGVVACGSVRIESGVFVGAGAILGPGITIGENSIIGAGSVVLKDVASNTVVQARNPQHG
jgi:sugar O-acyltransferase (sialic acid O-acetyltransferase NeuD family)